MQRFSSPNSTASSPLSMAESDVFEAEYYNQQIIDNMEREILESHMPPAKRQRLGDGSLRATPFSHEIDEDGTDETISSDTSGDLPQTPSNARLEDEDGHHEQVTTCAWENCGEGDFGNMDKLVKHIHNDHIESRQKKYTCEWEDCSRKSMPHASAYALKAHMRSHTREKPFYCALPECDRSFTRSDALAKHMRTVHETEALRPSDPIPKSMQPQAKTGNKLKIVIKQQGQTNGESHSQGPGPNSANPETASSAFGAEGDITQFPAELGFTPDELALGAKELSRLLRRQLHWAEEEAESLKQEAEMMDEIRKKEWLEKEILLDQVIKNEMDWLERRRIALSTLPLVEEIRAQTLAQMETAVEKANEEEPREDQREAAAVLASLHQS